MVTLETRSAGSLWILPSVLYHPWLGTCTQHFFKYAVKKGVPGMFFKSGFFDFNVLECASMLLAKDGLHR